MRLILCRSGYEHFLVRELADAGLDAGATGPGWVTAPEPAGVGLGAVPEGGWTFAGVDMDDAREMRGASVNELAQQLAEWFGESVRGEKLESPWPRVFLSADGTSGLGRRAAAVERAFGDLLARRLGRVARLAVDGPPTGCGTVRGLFAFFTGFDSLIAGRSAWLGGQRRMADDPAAPSRSYLKIEEAYGLLDGPPQAGQTVCDLGAAPGGWSYSAARRGALVKAVDNGPLKDGALNHPLIEHIQKDAFGFRPQGGAVFDWMFCDLVEEPHHVLRDLVEPWLAAGWCRRFVVILKFGRTDPPVFLRELRAPDSTLRRLAPGVVIRHLYHNREEFTLVGRTA